MSSRIPITIVTGFLGTGKTTLLRYLLSSSGLRLGVMVNEFGSVGLDGDLVKSCGFCSEDEIEDRLIELNNGCLCCTVQEEFLPSIEALLARSEQLDGIVIETSGLALPRPLLQALDWPAIRSRVHLNGVITLVDGEALAAGSPVGDPSALERQRVDDPNIDHLTPLNELFSNQIQAADLLLISRADLLSPNDLNEVSSELLNKARKGTIAIPISHGQVDPSLVLGLDRDFSRDELDKSVDISHNDIEHVHEHSHVQVTTWTIRLEVTIDRKKTEELLQLLASDYQLVRVKGRIWLSGKELPLQLQMVGPRLASWFESAPTNVWKPNDSGIELVIISLQENISEDFNQDLKDGLL